MKKSVKRLVRLAAGVVLGFGRDRECPLCGWKGFQFLPRTNKRIPAADANCPGCGSTERHRFAYFALKRRLPENPSTLHFAPERQIDKWLKSRTDSYRSCDIVPGRAMDRQDITSLTYPDAAFDLVWCSHVLEHVENDTAAMRELYRVLKPGGLCMIQVPIWRRTTYEDFSIKDPVARREHFGREDHVRLYGFDIADRLASIGFRVETVITRDFDPRIVALHGLNNLTTSEIYLCHRDGN